jgi:hypothetical protein
VNSEIKGIAVPMEAKKRGERKYCWKGLWKGVKENKMGNGGGVRNKLKRKTERKGRGGMGGRTLSSPRRPIDKGDMSAGRSEETK